MFSQAQAKPSKCNPGDAKTSLRSSRARNEGLVLHVNVNTLLSQFSIFTSKLVRLTVSRQNVQNFRYFGNRDLHYAGANKMVEMREFISDFNKVPCRRGRYEA
jgi:hypothetical protein